MRQIRRGFTLVEMLIVIVVLMILVALLFPVMGRMREKGKQTACQSNLKQIFLGVQQYLADSDSKHPSFVNWHEAVSGYVKDDGVFRCPSSPTPIAAPDGRLYSGEYNFYVGFLNSLVTEQAGGSSRQAFVGTNDSALVDASKIFVSGDPWVYGFYREVSMPRPDACGITMGNGKPDNVLIATTIHSGGGNSLFYDGHVKWMTPEELAQAYCDSAKYLHPPFRVDGEHVR